MVYRRCLRLLGTRARAEEGMQDVFVKVLQARETLDLESNPGALLYRIATHVCFNLLRSSKRRPEVADSDLILELAESQGSVTDPTDASFVKALLDSEEESTRLMATYHYIDGMTIEELAAEFNMSGSGIKKRLQNFKLRAKQWGQTDGN